MFPDPDQLATIAPSDILLAAAAGHLGLDQRFLRALLDRPSEAQQAAIAFAARDRSQDAVDLAPELIALFRVWRTPEAVPFLVDYLREDPENVPDEAMEALVAIGRPALESLLSLYGELDESVSGEVAFLLASLRVRDERILQLLIDRLDYDLSDTILLLGIYGDPAAIPSLEKARASLEDGSGSLRREIDDALFSLRNPPASERPEDSDADFDIWELYPPVAELPVDLLDEDDRIALLDHAVPSVRAAAAHSFFNRDVAPEQRAKLLECARTDPDHPVRAHCWEALINSTDQPEVISAMLAALRDPSLSDVERKGLLVGMAPETERNEVRKAIVDLYQEPAGRAKALEAMWRSMHPAFRDYFAQHLDDKDLEVRRGAIWGIGYYGLKSELDRIRKLFADEELRSDALFAYALALPTDISRGRMKSILGRIEKDASGLSEMEEELVKAALDERLMLAGKEPVFRDQED